MYECKQKGDAPTEPPVLIDFMEFVGVFGCDLVTDQRDDNFVHLTNYQDAVYRLYGTWAANKASAQANGELITKLRKKIKKVKKALRS